MKRSDELESGTAFSSTWALASGPAHCLEINNVRPVKCNLGKYCYFLIEPASGYSLQIVANHVHEDHVRLRLAAELQHTGHVSAWLDFLAKITGGVIKASAQVLCFAGSQAWRRCAVCARTWQPAPFRPPRFDNIPAIFLDGRWQWRRALMPRCL